jgi:hypothetical protein
MTLITEHKQLREVQKRAFDEVTICRRATEEALTALAHHFPDTDRSALEEQLQGLLERTPRRSTPPCRLDLLEAWQALRNSAEKPSIKRAMTESDSGTKNQTTDLLVSLVTTAFRRKLRAFFEPNSRWSTYHRD